MTQNVTADRLCANCGHAGTRGSAPSPVPDAATWPAIVDSTRRLYRRTDVSVCSGCQSISVTYVPSDDDAKGNPFADLLLSIREWHDDQDDPGRRA